jgi:glycosyltransferase involved in cell wall biosynthesis|tara:strand:- start:2111 stop:3370 length:1260 start_codon:yes stop_codon:yes gene_type:complete
MSDKIKVFTISDHPLSPSGVGTQTRYVIEGLLKTGKYQFISFGGAISHPDHTPQKTEAWGEDWVIWPIDGYGTQDQVRAMISQQKPDILWFMTDPRFYEWLWAIENEIRTMVPMVYYHVWDNYPYPHFNRKYYESNDHVACISKLTYDVVQTVAPDTDSSYMPHAVDTDVFCKLEEDKVMPFKLERFGKEGAEKFYFFWNNRNARRKQSGSLIFWFKKFLDVVGHDKSTLIMHTDPKDHNGQDLQHIIQELGLVNGEVLFSREKIDANDLAAVYNMVDCTINISDAEGFGLATLESLACEKPIIVTLTGGMKDQITDGETVFGVGIEPASKAVIGSQTVPYIYEDRLSEESVVNAMLELYNKTPEERAELGRLGREYVIKQFNFEEFVERWDDLLTSVHDTKGSWDNRQGYKPYGVRVL